MSKNLDQSNGQLHESSSEKNSRTITDKMMKVLTGRSISTEHAQKIIAYAKIEVAKSDDTKNVLWDKPNIIYDQDTFRKVKISVAKVAIRYLRYLAKNNFPLNDAELNITKLLSLNDFLNLRN